MSWDNVDNKHTKHFDSNFVSCDEAYERAYIIHLVAEEFPGYNEEKIVAAVMHCCRTIPAPRPRKQFWNCVAAQLEK